MNMLVTGGAGFIGSNLCHTLMHDRVLPVTEMVVIDNLMLGKKEFLRDLMDRDGFFFYREDLLNFDAILEIFRKHRFQLVWHLSANSDIGYGSRHTDWDLKQNTLVTYHVLECMRLTGVRDIVFASTSAVYGVPAVLPTPEDYGPLLPISLYGASKLACEGFISAFCDNFGLNAWIYRFGNIIGKNGTHGAAVDFINKLRQDPRRLEILGDGRQAKPYLYVQDCLDGMIFGYQHARDRLNYFNLAGPGATPVDHLADRVIGCLNLPQVVKTYTGGDRGWPGDVPQVRLDHRKLAQLGWTARYSSDEAVARGVKDLVSQLWDQGEKGI